MLGRADLGCSLSPRVGLGTERGLGIQDCPMAAALGLQRVSWRQDWSEDLGSHGGLAGRQVGAGNKAHLSARAGEELAGSQSSASTGAETS